MSTACFVIPSYLLYLRTGAVPFALLIGLLLGATPFVYVLHKRRQRFNKFEEELPEALNLMVSALRAGHSLVAALGLVGSESPDPIGGEFKICCDEQNYGLELRTALDNLVSPGSAAGRENRHHRDSDSKGERRKSCRGARQDGLCHPGKIPPEAAGPYPYRPGAPDRMDSLLSPHRARNRLVSRQPRPYEPAVEA